MADVIVLNEIDSAKQELSTQIGVTTNTGGTSTTGTIMAKLNALLTWFTGTWTAARAGKIDTINNYTVTNNTASTTGVLSQKVSAVIGKREASLTGVGATVFSYSPVMSCSFERVCCMAKFIAPVDGVYTCTMDLENLGSSHNVEVHKVVDIPMVWGYYDTRENVKGGCISQAKTYQLSSLGTGVLGLTDILGDTNDKRVSVLPLLYAKSVSKSAPSESFSFYCKAGEFVTLGFYTNAGGSASDLVRVSNVNITYQPEY